MGNTAQLKCMYDELNSISEVEIEAFNPEADIT
jgi:hypothetical protein